MTLTVLYIAGFGHSGSTMLGDVLGSLDGVFHAGEVFRLSQSLAADRLCDCGHPFWDCEIWGPALASMVSEGSSEGSLLDGSWRYSSSARLALFRSLASSTGDALVVDGSKRPEFGLLLADTPGVRLQVLHLVRDGRANVLSRVRRGRNRKLKDAGPLRVNATILSDARKWTVVNASARDLESTAAGYVSIRYEDFAFAPDRGLQFLRGHLDLPPSDRPLATGIEIGQKHTAYGNRDHRNLDRLEIKLDERWVTEMSPIHHSLVTAIQMRSLHRYGYPLGRSMPADLGTRLEAPSATS